MSWRYANEVGLADPAIIREITVKGGVPLKLITQSQHKWLC